MIQQQNMTSLYNVFTMHDVYLIKIMFLKLWLSEEFTKNISTNVVAYVSILLSITICITDLWLVVRAMKLHLPISREYKMIRYYIAITLFSELLISHSGLTILENFILKFTRCVITMSLLILHILIFCSC